MKKRIFFLVMVLGAVSFFTAICQVMGNEGNAMKEKGVSGNEMMQETKTAVFAGGCFWCTESDFEKVDGVIEAVSGYTGGHVVNPTYKQVSIGGTGHVESVMVTYDPRKVSYEDLLRVFWYSVNPTDDDGQFCDKGKQYRSVIFVANDQERKLAETTKEKLAASGVFNSPIVTEILPLGPFYPAEEYHQNYYKKNPIRYHFYRSRCGRDKFLEKIWGDLPEEIWKRKVESVSMTGAGSSGSYIIPGDEELRKRLTALQYDVVRKEGTEPAFHNEFWNNHEDGIYVDIVSGEPLFSSLDKFDSGTGWPSFTRPLVSDNIVEKKDRSFFMTRTEVRSRHADSHLGHVFSDGPAPTGLRYCINSAALRFIPKNALEKEGYGQFEGLFHAE